MSGLVKPEHYLKENLFSLLLIGFISLGTIGGCNNNNSGGTNQETNQPPQAELEVLRILPGRVDVHAGESVDPDGHIELYDFWLQDGDTQEVLAGPITTREPWASLIVDLNRNFGSNVQAFGALNRNLGPNVQAMVTVQDNNKAIDMTAAPAPLGATDSCSNANFQCTLDSSTGNTTCTPLGNGPFTTADLLDAATMWAFGIGAGGSHSNTHSGTGGAATLLRSTELVNQRKAEGVLLIGPGGGGGGAADGIFSGHGGGIGGIALSSTSGPCPGATCLSGSSGGDSTLPGCTGGSGGSGGGGGGGGPGLCNFVTGTDCCGSSGIGGGGGIADGRGASYWIQGNPLVNLSEDCDGTPGECNAVYAGQGGPNPGSSTCHGSGGGGYGGGSGGTSDEDGGGGGGAYAYTSTWEITDKPGTSSGNGYLTFTFFP